MQTTADTGGKRQPRPNRIYIRDAIEGFPANHIIGAAPFACRSQSYYRPCAIACRAARGQASSLMKSSSNMLPKVMNAKGQPREHHHQPPLSNLGNHCTTVGPA